MTRTRKLDRLPLKPLQIRYANQPSPRSRQLRRAVMRAVRAGAGLLGEDVLKRSYHSPVVHLEDLPNDIFDRQDPLRGVDLDLIQQLDLMNELEMYIAEFEPPAHFFDNIMYGSLDAEFLYAITRKLRPKRIIELGSGSTSVVIASASRRNAEEDGSGAHYRVFDPFPSETIKSGIDGLKELWRVDAGQIAIQEFAALQADDILFVDTTHTVKVGSEVNYIILEVLPSLAPGVYIHFHDIFLPYAYPRAYLQRHLFYVEQYLLQAFLAYNPHCEVVFAAHAIERIHRGAVRAAIPSSSHGLLPDGPSSFWIRRR